jgi:cell division protein FtsL
VLALALVASCLLLVTAQHRARSLFVDVDRAQQQARALEAEGNRLRVELGRVAQPGAIDTAARQFGLKPIDAARTLYFPGSAPQASR